MAISVTCDCGRALRAKDEAAGKRVRCPGCGNAVQVPAADAALDERAFEDLMSAPSEYDLSPPPPPPPTPPSTTRPPPPLPSRPANWGSSAVASGNGAAKASRTPRVVFEEGWFGSVNSGVIGGILMMVVAAAWFGLGLMANRIFFYPPVLFIIGLVAVFKGMFGGD
jgi:hypothetical protein